MRADEVPPGYTGVRCLRCDDVLAVPCPDGRRPEIGEAARDHHLYLCARPTPNVAAWRAAGMPEARLPPPPS